MAQNTFFSFSQFGCDNTEAGKFVAPNNVMPERFNSISEPKSFPLASVGITHEFTENSLIVIPEEKSPSE